MVGVESMLRLPFGVSMMTWMTWPYRRLRPEHPMLQLLGGHLGGTHVAGKDQHTDPAPRYGCLYRYLQETRHLLFTRHQLTEMAAFKKKPFGMRFLKKVRADLARWNLRGNREDWRERLVRIEQTVDEMKVPRSAASRAYRQVFGQLGFRARGERARFLMTHMNPFDIPVVM